MFYFCLSVVVMLCISARLTRTVRHIVQMAVRGVSELAPLQNGYGGSVGVRTESDVAIITIDRGENRMNDEFIDQVNGAMDEALRHPELKAIITTGGGEKFYSNGLDLIWMMEIQRSYPDYLLTFIERWHNLMIRMLTCPVLTIAAVNGHAYAGGGILSMAHDLRIMREDRGYWCMNEAQMGFIVPDYICKFYSTKLGGHGARALIESVTYGRRYSATEAKLHGIVDDTCAAAQLLPRALALVNETLPGEAPTRDYVSRTKHVLYKEAVELAKHGTRNIIETLSRL